MAMGSIGVFRSHRNSGGLPIVSCLRDRFQGLCRVCHAEGVTIGLFDESMNDRWHAARAFTISHEIPRTLDAEDTTKNNTLQRYFWSVMLWSNGLISIQILNLVWMRRRTVVSEFHCSSSCFSIEYRLKFRNVFWPTRYISMYIRSCIKQMIYRCGNANGGSPSLPPPPIKLSRMAKGQWRRGLTTNDIVAR